MKRSSVLLFAGLCLLAPRGLCAEERAGIGTTGADFLKIGAGARPAALADAFSAVADETSALFYNPAGLAFAFSPELQTMYSLWLGDLSYGYLGYSHPTPSGTWGLGFQYLSSPATPRITEGVKSGEFTYYDGAASLAYGARLGETTALGVTLRSIQSRIADSQASAFTGDAGFLYRTLEEGFSFGLSGQNLYGELSGEKLPATYRAGMAFKASLPQHFSDLLFTLEAGQTGTAPVYYAAGLEHLGAGVLALRAGYKYVPDEKQRQSMGPLAPWRAGIGLRIKSLALDYAYQPFEALGVTHRLSLSWRMFGWQAKWRMVPAQVKADPVLFSPNKDSAKDSVFFMPQAAQIKDVKNWELLIQDIGHKTVKKFSGKDMLPKILSWEGQTDSGEYVTEGKYYCSFTAEGDGRKRAQSDPGEITADLTPPAASLQVSNPSIAPGVPDLENMATFYVSVSDVYGVDQWQLTLLNEKKKNVKVFKSTASVPVEILWDGADDFYGSIVPNGEYEARLTAWDAAGNRTRVSQKIRVYVPPKVEIKEVIKEIEVKQETRGLVVNLSSQVMFGVGKTELRPEAFKALDEVVNLLQTYPENEVLIEGHTDSQGGRQKNTDLSSARAWSVYSYIVKKGVAPARLKPKGYGPDKPVTSNRTAWGRAQNRRVEIIILKKD
ncbi:MAG: PorV/PorQ family protein [Endomicrobiales bacterium]